jgi:predicted PurR-regulated permease PerM
MPINTPNAVKYILLAIFAFLTGYIIWPFLSSIIFALIFTISFYPLFKIFNKKLKIPKVISAILILLITLIFIFTPLVLFFGLVAKEAYVFITTFDQNAFWQFFDQYSNIQIAGFEIDLTNFKDSLQGIIQTAAQTILQTASNIGRIIANFSFLFFVFLFLYIFFLIDADKMLKSVQNILPFNKKQNNLLLKQFQNVSKSVFVGNLIAAVLSGIIAYIGLSIPGALIWALLAGLLSLIPTIGSFIVYAITAGIAYFLSGIMPMLMILAYYIIFEIIFMQSIIKPKLVEEKISVHPVLVFFALVGGVHAFGSIGIIYGPLIIVLFVTMYEFVVGTEKL